MDGYSVVVESQMVRFYRSLNERDRRRYAAVEAAKLGHGVAEVPFTTGQCLTNARRDKDNIESLRQPPIIVRIATKTPMNNNL